MDVDKILNASGEEQLQMIRKWLFQENVRIQEERAELERMRERFIKERDVYRQEMDALNHRMVVEQRRLREENMFFEKKMAILQNGFQELERDRQALEREKKAARYERAAGDGSSYSEPIAFLQDGDDFGAALFRGVNNPLALRKRYRELVKIFHPDNFCGDEQIMEIINREFARRKEEY